MFASIRLRDFKCYSGSTGDIALKPLTVIIGANNSGKSTLLQALLLIKQTLADRSRAVLVTTGPWVDLGAFQDIVHRNGGTTAETFSIAVTRDQDDYVRVENAEKKGTGRGRKEHLPREVDATFGFDSDTKQIAVDQVFLRRNGQAFAEVYERGARWRVSGVSDAASKRLNVEFQHFFPAIFPKGLRTRRPVALRGLERARRVAGILGAQAWIWESFFARIRHVAPLRPKMPWYGRIGEETPDTGFGGHNLLQRLASKFEVPGSGKSLMNRLNRLMCKEFKVLDALRFRSLDTAGTVVSLEGDEIGGAQGINVAAMGEGVSQMLPIVAESLASREGDCLLVEQPEIHLHPAAHAHLADLFIQMALGGRQFIVETHSEHVLLRLRRRVAEGKMPLEKVAILYVEKKGGCSSVRQLTLNDRGHYDDWPEGFFDEAYQEAMTLAELSSRRKAQ